MCVYFEFKSCLKLLVAAEHWIYTCMHIYAHLYILYVKTYIYICVYKQCVALIYNIQVLVYVHILYIWYMLTSSVGKGLLSFFVLLWPARRSNRIVVFPPFISFILNLFHIHLFAWMTNATYDRAAGWLRLIPFATMLLCFLFGLNARLSMIMKWGAHRFVIVVVVYFFPHFTVIWPTLKWLH